VEAEFHARLLGDGTDLGDEVLVGLPELLARDVGGVVLGATADLLDVEPRRERSAAFLDVGLRARPADAGHPVVTDHGDVESTAVADELLEHREVLVATLATEPNTVGERDGPL
jgi:hypothetical protein